MKAPVLSQRLSGIDAAFLYLERKEIPLNIASVSIFDGPIAFDEFLHIISSRLHLLPRYTQIVVAPPFNIGYPVWEHDPGFNIHEHIFSVKLDPPGGEAELEALAGRILSGVMDRTKPLWDVHIVDGLKDGRGALILRVHHALADGISGAALIKALFDSTPFPAAAPKKRRTRKPKPEPVDQSVADAVASAVHSSLQNMIAAEEVLLDFAQGLLSDRMQGGIQGLMSLLPELAASSERFPFNKPCTGDRKFCWTEFPFADLQQIKTAVGGTSNDVILAIVTAAVSRYVELHGEPVTGRFLRMVCPVNVRRNDNGESLGNQISFLPVAVPLGISDPVCLLKAIAARTEIMKSARASHLVALLAAWLGATPPPIQALFWNTIPTVTLPLPLLNMICTNVPGSPTPLYATGRRMIAAYPHVPTGYELGVNIAVQSYDGKAFFGLTADAHVVPDVNKLRNLLGVAFRDLCRAAGVKPSTTRQAPAPAWRPRRSRIAKTAVTAAASPSRLAASAD